MAQWLRPHATNAGSAGLIPGQGNKSLHAVRGGQKKILEHVILLIS